MQAQMNMQTVWYRVVDEVKHRIIHPTLWKALEAGIPVIIEDGQFVVGFPMGTFHLASHLNSLDHKNVIEATIAKHIGEQLSLRIIDGATLEDWQAVKVKETYAASLREAAARKRLDEKGSVRVWETVLEQVGRKYATMPNRQFAQSRALYITEALKMISEAMDNLIPAGEPPDILTERAISRILEKVAALVEVPSTLVALELMRIRQK